MRLRCNRCRHDWDEKITSATAMVQCPDCYAVLPLAVACDTGNLTPTASQHSSGSHSVVSPLDAKRPFSNVRQRSLTPFPPEQPANPTPASRPRPEEGTAKPVIKPLSPLADLIRQYADADETNANVCANQSESDVTAENPTVDKSAITPVQETDVVNATPEPQDTKVTPRKLSAIFASKGPVAPKPVDPEEQSRVMRAIRMSDSSGRIQAARAEKEKASSSGTPPPATE